ncbi:hypothetical protein Tsubulata_033751 [Turnera subulata]|uniref:Peptidase A1 domain-containing protein n=1 Tax=Turnera subulata TaxID=218843 RepID=A0A9Q0FYP6_9ROSI|nr:hypothetical protein Tsubulata_033751 [Turnera subulata]
MDPSRVVRGWFTTAVLVVVLLQLPSSSANMVFRVQHKFAGRHRNLSEFRAHDAHRHARLLSAVDLPLGGNGHPAEAGLYFAKIGLGNPSKDYYVQVDTGSDILWVNCVNCDRCPKKSDLGMKLTLYDPGSSASSSRVTCADEFCTMTYNGEVSGCTKEEPCNYQVKYGDGSSTTGFFVRDTLQFDRVVGNYQTAAANGTVSFGCGAVQSGELGSSSEALDGILGFGQSNSSVISQLASAGKVKRVFAHCLDNINGGGIFAIGEVVAPKVSTTPMVPNQQHYNVVMKEIEVGGNVIDLPTDSFDSGYHRGTIIDSGTTLTYLPEVVYDSIMSAIKSAQPGLALHTVETQFLCFQYSESVDDGFPVVKFHFEESLTLTVYPHDYLFQIKDDVWCFGWMNSGVQSKDGRDMTLLGDLVLSNKLVLYDLENQAIGWTEYNCSSSIKVKDESGKVYTVGAENISSASRLISGSSVTFLLLIFALLHRFV